MIILRNGEGKTIANVSITPSARRHIVLSSTLARPVLEALRALPRETMSVDIQYPSIGRYWVPFNRLTKAGSLMNIEQFVEQTEVSQPDAKVIFVAPAGPELPDDGMLQYMTVESIYDISSVPDRHVALFSEKSLPVLKCVSENSGLYGVELRVLSGLPGSDYSAEFDAVVWNLERIAYAPLVNEIRVQADIEKQVSAQNVVHHDAERSSYTRANGSVKELRNVVSLDIPDEATD